MKIFLIETNAGYIVSRKLKKKKNYWSHENDVVEKGSGEYEVIARCDFPQNTD